MGACRSFLAVPAETAPGPTGSHVGPCADVACADGQAKIYAYLGGSPQVFNPAGAQWYNDVVGVSNVYRVINNKDIVPDGPPDVIVSYDTGCAPPWQLVATYMRDPPQADPPGRSGCLLHARNMPPASRAPLPAASSPPLRLHCPGGLHAAPPLHPASTRQQSMPLCGSRAAEAQHCLNCA